ncbi:MAG: molecular chaperone HtpG [Candidatus Midichloriaceae bacterium]|jgi:molecular chaperone HtpG
MSVQKQTKKFDAEIGKVLNLVINSIYTNKEIFLRELISNSSDACDKLRYQSINNPSLIKNDSEFKISVNIDSEQKTITITDNGIGMSKEELINNLGTIASSGTQKFIDQLSKNKEEKDYNLIGQFGVGFYSSFMVSDNVTVITKKAGETEAYKWISDGKNEYSIESHNEENFDHGTKIILLLKESEVEFLESHRIRHIINTYSDHIGFTIELINNQEDAEIVNKGVAIWMKNTSEISKEEYEEFFSHVSHFPGKPWMTLHNKVEGALEYNNLLFIPENKPFDLFHPDRKTRVKLYIKRVFISEEGNDLIPSYLRFLRGVVDSEDLPLNISRETLQNNVIVHKIKKSIVKKVLSSLKKKAVKNPDEYEKFWNNFSEVLKEGLCENTLEEKEQILEICKFNSTKNPDTLIGLDDYIKNMIEGQKHIYFLNGDNLDSLKKNPQLEGFKKRDIEVLLLKDHVDNFWVNAINKYKDIELHSILSNKINLDEIKNLDTNNKEEKDTVNKALTKDVLKLLEFIKNILGDKVKEVVVSTKLVDSPACISITEGSMSPRMEKFLIEQKQMPNKSARILEINPNHVIMKKINNSLQKDIKNDQDANLIHVIYVQACLIEGDSIDSPSDFAQQLNSLLEKIV